MTNEVVNTGGLKKFVYSKKHNSKLTHEEERGYENAWEKARERKRKEKRIRYLIVLGIIVTIFILYIIFR